MEQPVKFADMTTDQLIAHGRTRHLTGQFLTAYEIALLHRLFFVVKQKEKQQ